MTDIVDRLRELPELEFRTDHARQTFEVVLSVHEEAAREIERLRRVIAEYEKPNSKCWPNEVLK